LQEAPEPLRRLVEVALVELRLGLAELLARGFLVGNSLPVDQHGALGTARDEQEE
jgi:hypothetical protein